MNQEESKKNESKAVDIIKEKTKGMEQLESQVQEKQ